MQNDHPWIPKLRELLLGAQVVAVDPGHQDAVACFTVLKDNQKLKFTLNATDLGSWISQVVQIQDPDVKCAQGREYWQDADALLTDLQERAYDLSLTEEAKDLRVEPLEDVFQRAFGFKLGDQEWWVKLAQVKGSKRKEIFLTPDSRRAYAELLIRRFRV